MGHNGGSGPPKSRNFGVRDPGKPPGSRPPPKFRKIAPKLRFLGKIWGSRFYAKKSRFLNGNLSFFGGSGYRTPGPEKNRVFNRYTSAYRKSPIFP